MTAVEYGLDLTGGLMDVRVMEIMNGAFAVSLPHMESRLLTTF